MEKVKAISIMLILSMLFASCSMQNTSSTETEASPVSTNEVIFIYPSTDNPEEQPFYLDSLIFRQTSSCEEYSYENNVIYRSTTVVFINGELHIKSAGFPIIRTETVGVEQMFVFVETIPCTGWIYSNPKTGECFFENEIPEEYIIESDGIISMNEAYELFLNETQVEPMHMLAYYQFEDIVYLDGHYCYVIFCQYTSDNPDHAYDKIKAIGYIDIFTGEIICYKSSMRWGSIVLEEYSNGFSQETIDELNRLEQEEQTPAN